MAESNTKKNSTQKLPLSVFHTDGGSFYMESFGFYSGDIKQSKLHAPPFEQSGQHPAFIAAEREVFGQDISVAPFEFPYQPAFGTISATEQRACAHIVRKNGQEQGILAEAAEKGVAAEQVGT